MPGLVRSRPLRIVLLGLGFFFLALGFVGTLLPFIPTTGPVILAGFLFSKSSERFDRWLLSNRLFGGIVRDWRSGVGFSVRAKVIAVTAIVATFSFTVFFATDSAVVRVAMVLLALAIASYVVSRPTKRAPVKQLT
jgi:uncharacterized membrane protein YbaN (DUF454 family)